MALWSERLSKESVYSWDGIARGDGDGEAGKRCPEPYHRVGGRGKKWVWVWLVSRKEC